MSEFNPDVRNICLVDVIALRTSSVVVPPDPVRLKNDNVINTWEKKMRMVNPPKIQNDKQHNSYLQPVRETGLVHRIPSNFTQVTGTQLPKLPGVTSISRHDKIIGHKIEAGMEEGTLPKQLYCILQPKVPLSGEFVMGHQSRGTR